MKIGIVGGTFDPFHRGHLDPVLAARQSLQWDSIVYIPAHRQPFKAEQATTSGYHRFAMAILATEDFEDLFVSPRELDRGTISYTVETLEALRAENPQATLDWIIGDDNLAELERWKNIDRIFELANFVVLTRHVIPSAPSTPLGAGSEREESGWGSRVVDPAQRGTHGSITFAENRMVPVSSTEIRRRIRAGESIGDLVDPRVSRYIHHNRLYREAQA
jgi:nicotinate-nucleotide adenylyltransferase